MVSRMPRTIDMIRRTTIAIAFGASLMAQSECPTSDADGGGWTSGDGDCNDNDVSTHPGANEICEEGDATDNDCDGTINEGICCGDFQLLSSETFVSDLAGLESFLVERGCMIGYEIVSYDSYYLGISAYDRDGDQDYVIGEYIAWAYPDVAICDYALTYHPKLCPPQGGVLFIQPEGYAGSTVSQLRSESDANCTYSEICPTITPGACWAEEFGNTSVAEIWVRYLRAGALRTIVNHSDVFHDTVLECAATIMSFTFPTYIHSPTDPA